VKAVWGAFACAALLVSACSTTEEMAAREGARSGMLAALPPMPDMPSLPTIRISDLRVPGTFRQAPVVDPDLESIIYWRVIEDDILIVHADTNGCTLRSDFLVRVTQYHEDIYTVSLERQAPDVCSDDVPWGVQLGFGFEELGVPTGGEVVLLNPVDDRPWDWYEERTIMAARR
jgi:hypothetical protein